MTETLLTDGYGEFSGWNTESVKHSRWMRMKLRNLEQGKHNHNHIAERDIGFLAIFWRILMTKKEIPKRLWHFGIFYKAGMLSIMSRGKGKWTGYEEFAGQMLEIGEYLEFEFCNFVW